MKEPGVHLGLGVAGICGTIDSQHHSVSSRRRRIAIALVGSEEAIGKSNVRRAEAKGYRIGGPAAEHAGAVKRKHTHAVKRGGTTKQVHRKEIGILSRAPASIPHGEFRIVSK